MLHWQLGMLRYAVEELDLPFPSEDVNLPAQSEAERYAREAGATSVPLGPHPIACWRTALDRRGFANSTSLLDLPVGQRVEIVGIVIIHQAPPTAKGFHFLTLEDERGMINVIVQLDLAATLLQVGEQTVRVAGVVQREGTVTNLIATVVDVVGLQ